MAHSTNVILQALPQSERDVLSPLFKQRVLNQQDILFDVRQEMETVFFPFDAVISLVVPLSSGEVVEAAMVGHDGILGAAAVVNGRISLNRAVVQLAGGCSFCSVNGLRDVLPQCPSLRMLIMRHEQALFAQAQQSAACNISHQINARLARWLLRARDLHGSDELELTQEYMAEMLGVRRTTVSLTAHTLQQAGLIRYRRGRIKIDDLDGLNEVACECYEAVKMHYDQLKREATNVI